MNDMTNIFEIKAQHYWDFEAINLSKHYCQPTQMAVCRPDAKSNGQLKTREIAIRIPSSSIPDPSAVRVTLTCYRQMYNPSLISSYQLSRHLKNYLTANPGTTRLAFNARYDEDLLSQLLYRNAEDPYLGKKHNSGAQDARQLLLVSGLLANVGKGIPIPKSVDGTFDSTLTGIAGSTGADTSKAHVSPAADVEMMRNLLQKAFTICPELQSEAYFCQHKDLLRSRIKAEPFFLQVGFSKSSGVYMVPKTWIGVHPLYSNQDVCSKLSDPQNGNGKKERSACFSNFKANEAPLVIFRGPIMDMLLSREEQQLYADLSQLFRSNDSILLKAEQFCIDKVKNYPDPIYPEEQMVSGGFISNADRKIADLFHAADPAAKLAHIDRMSDDRLRYFAERVMYEEWPELLPTQLLNIIDDEVAYRLTTDEQVPWMTVGKALADIEQILPECNAREGELLEEYRHDLMELRQQPIRRLLS